MNFDQNLSPNFFFGVEKWNVGNRLKRVLAKFQANRSHPRGVNGWSKFCEKFEFFFRIFDVKKWKFGDHLKRVLAKFQVNRSHPRGVNGPSKFVKISKKIVFAVEKWNVGNHLKRVLAKFRANRSHPRGVNGRSKFENHATEPEFVAWFPFLFTKITLPSQ